MVLCRVLFQIMVMLSSVGLVASPMASGHWRTENIFPQQYSIKCSVSGT